MANVKNVSNPNWLIFGEINSKIVQIHIGRL